MNRTRDLKLVVGKRVKKYRAARKLTQLRLAVASGCDPSQISLIERGKRDPHLSTLGRIAAALGVQFSKLVA